MSKLVEVMEALYASEINCGVSSFWDNGFKVWIGDDMNGETDYSAFHSTELDTAAADFLHEMAIKRYPQSEYALQSTKG